MSSSSCRKSSSRAGPTISGGKSLTPARPWKRRTTLSKRKSLRPGQLWLMEILKERYDKGMREFGKPSGITRQLRTICAPELVDMMTLRGLVRRGWVSERESVGIFTITEEGLK